MIRGDTITLTGRMTRSVVITGRLRLGLTCDEKTAGRQYVIATIRWYGFTMTLADRVIQHIKQELDSSKVVFKPGVPRRIDALSWIYSRSSNPHHMLNLSLLDTFLAFGGLLNRSSTIAVVQAMLILYWSVSIHSWTGLCWTCRHIFTSIMHLGQFRSCSSGPWFIVYSGICVSLTSVWYMFTQRAAQQSPFDLFDFILCQTGLCKRLLFT
jgi:hypothetical protein